MKTKIQNIIFAVQKLCSTPDLWDASYGPDGWHDADYCADGDCRLAHRHDVNCRCPDCCAADDE